jgi:iron complex transport system substrate-binding protein
MWPQVDREWILARNPGVTILATPVRISGYDVDDPSEVAAVREQFLNLPEFAGIDSVKNEEVYVINYAHFMVGGASCLLASAYFAKWFHPDHFEDLDPQEIQQEYVTRFQHLDFNVAEHGVFVYPPMEER